MTGEPVIIVAKGGGPVLNGYGYSYFVVLGPGYQARGHASTRWGANRIARRVARGLVAQKVAADAWAASQP